MRPTPRIGSTPVQEAAEGRSGVTLRRRYDRAGCADPWTGEVTASNPIAHVRDVGPEIAGREDRRDPGLEERPQAGGQSLAMTCARN